MIIALFLASGAAIGALIAALNLAHYLRRSTMTAAQRQAEDDDLQRDMAVW